MKYASTRGGAEAVSASEAILRGIAPDGGLYVPQAFPSCEVSELYGLDYPETARRILRLFLTDYDDAFLQTAAEQSYGAAFGGKAGELVRVEGGLFSLELWHGPTSAFKDYALQLMPRLLVQAKKNLGVTDTTKILVATSGDTGKAALAGYAGLEGIKIAVFYPANGTSEIQRLQMATQEGDNVAVYAVKGNFDDAQTGVKRVFADESVAQALKEQNARLSSANSINWGRLVPQIVYYFYTYAQLVARKEIAPGARVSFCVPTGNFGDILAGYYAKRMGLPVDKLICASNQNNVLTDFLRTGTYNAQRPFYKTESPSMDILVSSNLERLLYHVTQDAAAVNGWMTQLAAEGSYTVPPETLAAIQETFLCGCADDARGAQQIAQEYAQHGYLCDTHTAVAFAVARDCAVSPCVVLSTANPYKFPRAVLHALGEPSEGNELALLDALHAKTHAPIPAGLAALGTKPVRFTETLDPAGIGQAALRL